ncbi:hypothetical protein [Arcanobacterium phocae]|nr:hypothetical protein [Arcanobacterium phocae]
MPRPTVRVLASLPLDSFREENQRKHVKAFLADPSHKLDMYQLDQPLLNEARRLFATGVPDRHKEATKAAKQPVYEVRDRQGAAWRGAVILDDEGSPWLVYVDRHDQFHAKVAQALSRKKSQNTGKSPLEEKKPRDVDLKLRKREELRITDRQWLQEVISSFISGIINVLKRAVSKR